MGSKPVEGSTKLALWSRFLRFILQPLDLWVVERNKMSSQSYLNGYSRMSAFMASDPDYVANIYRRFDELNIRNLLLLESRVAALETLQIDLDKEDTKRYERNPPFKINYSSGEGQNKEPAQGQETIMGSQKVPQEPRETTWQRTASERFTLATTASSFEYFAVLGTKQPRSSSSYEGALSASPEHGIPRFALQRWDSIRDEAKNKIEAQRAFAPIMEMEDTYYRNRWELALAIQKALKEYRKRSTCLKPPRRTVEALQSYLGGARPRMRNSNNPEAVSIKGRPPQFQNNSAASHLFDDANDLYSLHPPGDDDLGTRIVTWSLGWALRSLHAEMGRGQDGGRQRRVLRRVRGRRPQSNNVFHILHGDRLSDGPSLAFMEN
ncbi:hypothetical protein MGU_10563 [Metarhizium guizhouense ARSEF 977]|uniref:DUF6594 domain-containing protein n=1 Tax=Metarhizium guizhouense (strain ARSEF 977) TaxID=1276136 RepID=A0A0B4GQW0_METGA|nr:hypothetical protein MGU_10563 [Metarhizium guizhouense ARSEF 977]